MLQSYFPTTEVYWNYFGIYRFYLKNGCPMFLVLYDNKLEGLIIVKKKHDLKSWFWNDLDLGVDWVLAPLFRETNRKLITLQTYTECLQQIKTRKGVKRRQRVSQATLTLCETPYAPFPLRNVRNPLNIWDRRLSNRPVAMFFSVGWGMGWLLGGDLWVVRRVLVAAGPGGGGGLKRAQVCFARH